MTTEERRLEKKYDVALATRNFEIELFWKRSIFFWGFIASAFVGYTTIVKDNEFLAILIACFGYICSVAWSLVNRGSKYWQENWETIVADIENDITGSLFKERGERQQKGVWLSSRKFSVSRVTIALSDFTILIWLAILGHHVFKAFLYTSCVPSGLLKILIVVGSLVFSFFMINSGRSTDAK